jgi:cytochrome c553
MKSNFVLIAIVVFLFACTTNEKKLQTNMQSEDTEFSSAEGNTVSELTVILDPALEQMVSLCFTCHTPDHVTTQRLAPPMYKVREHYYRQDISKEEFVSKVASYALNPTKEASIMPGAVRNFGLMPKSAFKEEDVRNIAAYIYDNDLSSDRWKEEWKTFQSLKQSQSNK